MSIVQYEGGYVNVNRSKCDEKLWQVQRAERD